MEIFMCVLNGLLKFAEMLIHFRSGKFIALRGYYFFSKDHADFSFFCY